MNLDKELLEILACPACKGDLKPLADAAGQEEGLACPKCAVVYPISRGIPIMIKEEGIPEPDWRNGKRYKEK